MPVAVRQAPPIERAADTAPDTAPDLAHAFNNVLSIIMTYCSLLESKLDDPVAAADLDQIRLAAERATALTRRLPGG